MQFHFFFCKVRREGSCNNETFVTLKANLTFISLSMLFTFFQRNLRHFMSKPSILTLGELKKSGYQPKNLKTELRDNLIDALKSKREIFTGIIGYENSVIPDVQRAILAGHNMNFLGLRGQAKTRIARLMTHLLDEWTPVVKDSELNDDPLNPIGYFAKQTIAENGDKTLIEWMHRSERYVEKLATPDVSIADLIGDVDPIKAANLRVGYNDERAIHFGLVPRSNRCIFVINELPDLQARIQVALFNILQEGDIQIRGFKLRMPLDIQFVFTANPEDYTNRGSIVTPLKDRIGSQILTHYPKDLETSLKITKQEARLTESEKNSVVISDLLFEMMENISFQARKSEFVDQKSGVSARLGISVLEAVVAGAERRLLINDDTKTMLRVSDLYNAVQAINGKIEMVYEGEQEGPQNVALNLIHQSIREVFLKYFPAELKKGKSGKDNFVDIETWFNAGNYAFLGNETNEKEYQANLKNIPGLWDLAFKESAMKEDAFVYLFMEFILHGLAAVSRISKNTEENAFAFKDLLGGIMSSNEDDDFEGGYYEE